MVRLKARGSGAAPTKMISSTSTCTGTDVAGVIQQTCSTQYAQSTSTDPTIYNGFQAGEIVVIVELFLFLFLGAILTYHVIFRRIKIKNQ